MNATSTFATPPIARSGFSTHTARQQAAWSSGDHAVTGTTTERAALFGAFRLLPAQQLLPDGLPPHGEERRSAVYAACSRLAAMRRISNHEARPWPPILRDAPAALLRMRRMFHQNFPPVPDLALPSHSTGAKP
jgi:hypothetical protein